MVLLGTVVSDHSVAGRCTPLIWLQDGLAWRSTAVQTVEIRAADQRVVAQGIFEAAAPATFCLPSFASVGASPLKRDRQLES